MWELWEPRVKGVIFPRKRAPKENFEPPCYMSRINTFHLSLLEISIYPFFGGEHGFGNRRLFIHIFSWTISSFVFLLFSFGLRWGLGKGDLLIRRFWYDVIASAWSCDALGTPFCIYLHEHRSTFQCDSNLCLWSKFFFAYPKCGVFYRWALLVVTQCTQRREHLERSLSLRPLVMECTNSVFTILSLPQKLFHSTYMLVISLMSMTWLKMVRELCIIVFACVCLLFRCTPLFTSFVLPILFLFLVEHLNPINVKIAELREALESVTAEQKYLKARDARHRRSKF